MDLVEPEYNTAVAAMRLQTPYLHGGHVEILDQLVKNHEKVIVMLGITPILGSRENPLTFEMRRQMLAESYPDIIVMKDEAVADDAIWSKRLDKEIKSILTPLDTVCLYGGRDSCLDQYSGKFPTREFQSTGRVSSTELRRLASRRSVNSEDFRAGVIWASTNGWPKVVPTVDIAILSEDGRSVLLGRKEHETKFRFPGGYADVHSSSYEADARREAVEETGLSITDPVMVGSCSIPDWRYENEADGIRTILFVAKKQFGSAKADDDLAAVQWFELDKIVLKRDIVPTHHELMTMLLEHLSNQTENSK